MATAKNRPPAPAEPSLDEVLAKRHQVTFYLEDEPVAVRLGRLLPMFGVVDLTNPEAVSLIVQAFYSMRDPNAVGFTLRRITATEDNEIREACDKTERTFDKKTDQFVGGEVKPESYLYRRLARAIVSPAVPGSTDDEKAAWLREHLTDEEASELFKCSKTINRLGLQKAMDQVKN